MLTWTKTLSVLSVAEAWKRVLFRTPPSLEALSRAPGIKDRWSGAFGWESRPSAGCITRSAPIAALSAAFWNLTPVSMISSRRLVLRRLRLSRRNHFSVNFYTHHDVVSSWMTRHFHEKAGSCQAFFLVVSTAQPYCRPTGGTISLRPFL